MKKIKLLAAGALFLPMWMMGQVQEADSTGLPGDNLDLYGVLDLFKQSSTVEEFEKAINEEKNKVNNLDLNGDGEIDYIRVIDNTEDNAHAFMLRVPLDGNENQDVAYIALEKKGPDEAHVQIIGDEDLYGADYIVEPSDELKSGGKGAALGGGLIVNVWFWPCVRFVYSPVYIVWVSPWYWGYYPPWWSPWRPMAWHHWHPHVIHYHMHYAHTHTCHVARAQNIYYGHRVRSAAVIRRDGPSRANTSKHDGHSRKDKAPGMQKDKKPSVKKDRSPGIKEKSPGGESGRSKSKNPSTSPDKGRKSPAGSGASPSKGRKK